jgi:hypothetical protein
MGAPEVDAGHHIVEQRPADVVPVHFQGRGSNIDVGQDVAGTLGSNADRASGGAPCIAFDTTQITSAANYSKPKAGDPCHPLAAGAHPPAIAFYPTDGQDFRGYADISPSVTVGSGGSSGNPPAVAFNWQQGGDHTTSLALEVERTPTIQRSQSLAVYQRATAFDLRGREGGAQFEGPHDTANIRAASGGSSRSYVAQAAAFMENQRAELRVSDQTDALVRGGGKPGQGYAAALLPTMQVRRLTPMEYERLQGFPDNWTLVPYRNKPASDGPRYKALGNSMAVPCMRWIGERIELIETLTKRIV